MICPHCKETIPYPYPAARKKARKKWRQSDKGKIWNRLYNHRKNKGNNE